jgi:ABC-type sugar transport system ATPase subunit
MAFLKVSAVSKSIDSTVVLEQISFSQRRLQKIAIAGETGSGKTTLLKIIAGLVQSDSGEVLFEDARVQGPHDKLVPGHPSIAYLSQHFELAKFLRVEQVLSYANTLSEDDAETLYEICEISHLLKRKTDELSGGERQRIALARLLSGSPELLLLDEPFSNLDAVHKHVLKSIIDAISKRLRITCMLVSHEPTDVLSWADRILVMRDGKIIQRGSPEKIYREPRNEYVAGLFGKYNLIGEGALNGVPSKGINPRIKNLFIRPEDLKITAKRSKIKGKVNAIKFFGGFYEVEVAVADSILTVKSPTIHLNNGDTVYLQHSAKDLWYI